MAALVLFWHLALGEVSRPLEGTGLFLNSQGLFRNRQRLLFKKYARPVLSEDRVSGETVKSQILASLVWGRGQGFLVPASFQDKPVLQV